MKIVLGLIASLFLSSAALAADMPQKAPAVSISSPSDLFSGWWLGGGVGYGAETVDPAIAIPNFKPSGVVVGGSLGYRAQIMPKVYLGLDGSLNWNDTDDNQSFGPIRADVNGKWYGAAGLSLGYAVMPDLLIAVTAGAAYGSYEAKISGFGGSVKAKDTQAGWYVGASADYALASLGLKGWTVGVDYKHIMYSDANFGFPIAAGITIGTKADITEDIVMVTGKYKFAM